MEFDRLEFKENLRRRLAIDIGNLLGSFSYSETNNIEHVFLFSDELVEKHPDDTASISLALQVRRRIL